MGRHSRDRPLGPPLWRQRLEPEQLVGEHVARLKLLTEPRLDRPQVLAHDEGAGALALQGEDVEQLGRRVADVGPLGRPTVGWDPEQPGQPHHVVDAQAG